jgi:hypothetical protein
MKIEIILYLKLDEIILNKKDLFTRRNPTYFTYFVYVSCAYQILYKNIRFGSINEFYLKK